MAFAPAITGKLPAARVPLDLFGFPYYNCK